MHRIGMPVISAMVLFFVEVARLLNGLKRGALHAVYGAPKIVTQMDGVAQKPSGVAPVVATLAQSTQPPATASQPAAVQQVGGAVSTSLTTDEAPKEAAHLSVSERVCVAEVYGAGRVLLGVIWIYLYPKTGTARRVFKIVDSGLAKALERDRYFYPDVPFEPKVGTGQIMADFRQEIGRLLDRRQPVLKARKAAMNAEETPSSLPASPLAKPVRVPTEPVAIKPPPMVPTTHIVTPAHTRKVAGEVYEGSVAHAGMTQKQGRDGAYQTFCLTIHDGVREIPLFGAELERQAVDMKIAPGEKVRVIFMGKQPVEIPGKPTSFKNLYQLSRANE